MRNSDLHEWVINSKPESEILQECKENDLDLEMGISEKRKS